MNHDDKKEKTEETFFNNLFEKKEKEQNEQLYKNEFYVLEEEMKTNKDQNSLQFMHDALLNKLMLEDYSPFPPKNEEPTIVNNQKDEKKKEDEQDKLIEEENEFLRNLHRINYLTFSPFGLSFFDDNKDNQNLSEDYLKEKEEKILHMIEFDYNDFEVTNDLLLYICQGFVDINKLKEENLTKNKTEIPTDTTNTKSNNNTTNSILMDKVGNLPIKEKKESEKEEDESEDELKDIVNKKKKIDFYKDIINKYEQEKKIMIKNNKKDFVNKWKNLFEDKDKEYEEHLKKLKEEEKKRKQEEKRLKDLEKKKERERQEQIRTQNLLKKGLESIVQKAKKKGMISNSSKKIKKKPKIKLEEKDVKKSLNTSVLSYKNAGNNSFISKKGLNKSVISSRRKRSDNSFYIKRK